MDLCGGSPVLLCCARGAPRAPLQVWFTPVTLSLPSRQSLWPLNPTPVLPVQQTHAALETTWHSRAAFPTGALACQNNIRREQRQKAQENLMLEKKIILKKQREHAFKNPVAFIMKNKHPLASIQKEKENEVKAQGLVLIFQEFSPFKIVKYCMPTLGRMTTASLSAMNQSTRVNFYGTQTAILRNHPESKNKQSIRKRNVRTHRGD